MSTPRSCWAQLPLFAFCMSLVGLFWLAAVDAPYWFDAVLYGLILVFNLFLIRFGSRRGLFVAVPFAGIYLGLLIVFIGLARKEVQQLRHLHQWQADTLRLEAAQKLNSNGALSIPSKESR